MGTLTDKELKQLKKEAREIRAKIRQINKDVKDYKITSTDAEAELAKLIERCKYISSLLSNEIK